MFSTLARILHLNLGWLALSSVCIEPTLVGAEKKLDGPVVKMAPFEVTALESSVKVRPLFLRTPVGPILETLTVVEVIPGSVAARLGLKKGMNILEFSGRTVAGMTEEEFDLLWRGPFWSAVTLKVITPKRFGREKPQEIIIPLRDEPVFAFHLSSPAPSENELREKMPKDSTVPPQEKTTELVAPK